jgi:hypothetical protein
MATNVVKGSQPAPGQVSNQQLLCPICGKKIVSVTETAAVSISWTCSGGHSGTTLAAN